MAKKSEFLRQGRVTELLLTKAGQHGTLDAADQEALCAIRSRTRQVAAGEDIVCQGDRPDVAVLVLRGMLARYHTLESGRRQYLSFHIAGDLPDLQSLFLTIMDHSLCALDEAEIATMPHAELRKLISKRGAVGQAFWRLTLVDAAIFRQAIANNSARDHVARIAHLFCEQYYRANEAGLVDKWSCSLPLSQSQLGQTLGMAHVSVNRAMQRLHKQGLAHLRAGRLTVPNWLALKHTAGFDPDYLHVDTVSGTSRPLSS